MQIDGATLSSLRKGAQQGLNGASGATVILDGEMTVGMSQRSVTVTIAVGGGEIDALDEFDTSGAFTIEASPEV